MTSVVRIRRKNGVIVQDCDVYIGRAQNQGGWNLKSSKWANPFPVKTHGLSNSLTLYKEYITKRIDEDPITYDLNELRGKRLGCWCDNRCHGDILVELIENTE